MGIARNSVRAAAAIAVLLAAFVVVMLLAPSAYAEKKNATDYEPVKGPLVFDLGGGVQYHEGRILITRLGMESIEVFTDGVAWEDKAQSYGVSYDVKSNTLTLDHVNREDWDISAHAMGDDFTIEVLGNCTINALDVTSYHYDENNNMMFGMHWGGSVSLVGSGRLLVSNKYGDEYNPWGVTIFGEGSEPILNIDKHVSLEANGYGTNPAIMVVRSAGFYSDKVILVDGKNITDTYSGYTVGGFQNEAEAGLKDYHVESNHITITGDGKTDFTGKELELSDKYLEYTGKKQVPKILSINGRQYEEGVDFEVVTSPATPKNAGNVTIYVKGIGNCTGDSAKATYKIFPTSNTVKIKSLGKTIGVNYNKKSTIDYKKYVKITNKKGSMRYSLSSAKKGTKSFKKKFSVSKTTGKLTVKKGLKKGTYTVKVKAYATGNSNYNASKKKTVTVKVKVK